MLSTDKDTTKLFEGERNLQPQDEEYVYVQPTANAQDLGLQGELVCPNDFELYLYPPGEDIEGSFVGDHEEMVVSHPTIDDLILSGKIVVPHPAVDEMIPSLISGDQIVMPHQTSVPQLPNEEVHTSQSLENQQEDDVQDELVCPNYFVQVHTPVRSPNEQQSSTGEAAMSDLHVLDHEMVVPQPNLNELLPPLTPDDQLVMLHGHSPQAPHNDLDYLTTTEQHDASRNDKQVQYKKAK